MAYAYIRTCVRIRLSSAMTMIMHDGAYVINQSTFVLAEHVRACPNDHILAEKKILLAAGEIDS